MDKVFLLNLASALLGVATTGAGVAILAQLLIIFKQPDYLYRLRNYGIWTCFVAGCLVFLLLFLLS